MSGRTVLSRPRTRIYDANYNIGENYYRPALDRLDRKYSGRPLSPPRQTSIPKDILERHERAFMDDDLFSARKRAEKHISEPNVLDLHRNRAANRALEMFDEDFESESAARQRRQKARREAAALNDLEMESMEQSALGRRIKEKSEKMFESVANGPIVPRRNVDEDLTTVKRRTLRVTSDETVDAKDLCRWTPLNYEKEETSASLRAKQSKARLDELEEEMNDMAERQAARERRAARLKAILAESSEDNDVDAVQAVRVSARREKRTVEF